MGAAVRRFDLLANAVCQSTSMSNDTPHSRASPLPQLFYGVAKTSTKKATFSGRLFHWAISVY
ncbi:hypothetical protein EMIT0P44_290077 [Pseudomonas sp. IT-P44]